jgi:hypothetical protein
MQNRNVLFEGFFIMRFQHFIIKKEPQMKDKKICIKQDIMDRIAVL